MIDIDRSEPAHQFLQQVMFFERGLRADQRRQAAAWLAAACTIRPPALIAVSHSVSTSLPFTAKLGLGAIATRFSAPRN